MTDLPESAPSPDELADHDNGIVNELSGNDRSSTNAAAPQASSNLSSVTASNGRSFMLRLTGFAGLPLLSLLAPFMLLPLIARLGGVHGWAALAIGQSVGAFAAIVVSFGWTLGGPAKVARATDEARSLLYGDSVVSRTMLLVVVSPLAAVSTFLLSPVGFRAESVAMAVAMAIGSLSPAWYCIGVGRPRLIATYEVIPRVVSVGIAAVLLQLTGDILYYPICLILATVGGVFAFSWRIGGLGTRSGLGVRRVLQSMWRDRSAAMTVLAAGAYSATPVTIMGIVSPFQVVAQFSSADKLNKISSFAIQVLGNSFQGWVAEDRPVRISRRMKASLMAHGVLGMFGFAGLALVGAPLTRFLFGDAVAADELTAIWYGVTFAAVSMNTSMGRHILVPLGRTSTVLRSTIAGAIVGVIAMAVLGLKFGSSGGAAGLAISEVMVCLVQLMGVNALRREGRRSRS